jgi:hypothetical protein
MPICTIVPGILSVHLYAKLSGIAVVPPTVFFGDEAFLDGVELDNEDSIASWRPAKIYRALRSPRQLASRKSIPGSSMKEPMAFSRCARKRFV